jgi:UDP-N-acetylmuramate: L-alanyl-gamma-D-glutamyl-meso-diaminopimelate ligase
VNLVPRRGLLLLGADNPEALALRDAARCRIETFGLASGTTWQAADLKVAETSTRFTVRRDGSAVGTFEVPLLGAFNVRNALAAIAVGAAVGLNTDSMAEGLRRFRGVRRRMELRGTVAGVTIYDDFAHHPTAIAETIEGVRSAYPSRKVWAIFEPRSATSCRRVFQSDFVRALKKAHHVILPAVFRSTLPEEQRLDAEQVVRELCEEDVDARFIPATADIVRTVAREAKDGDLVLVMSNGGFDNIHQKLIDALAAREAR